MAAHVVFLRAEGLNSNNDPAVGGVRVRESVAMSAVSTAVALNGEIVMVYNAEATAIVVAHGSTPDAAAVAETVATTAGFPVPAGAMSQAFALKAGSKISVKTLA